MHLDPTFNLGDFYVTPIVFPLINYVQKKNKCPPTLIGPVLIHHQMQFSTYSYFLNQIVSLKPEIRQIKAVGTDGEIALYSAVKEHFPDAIRLRCLKHIRDSIERKLSELQFDKMSTQEIVNDTFGTISDHQWKKRIGFVRR